MGCGSSAPEGSLLDFRFNARPPVEAHQIVLKPYLMPILNTYSSIAYAGATTTTAGIQGIVRSGDPGRL
jgi:hypothetical protein